MNELISKGVLRNKRRLLDYYRSRGSELIVESKQVYADNEYRKRATHVNKGLRQARVNLVKILQQKSARENWDQLTVLQGVLSLTYTNYVVLLEARNEVWPYEYMAFTRRIGELWEPFCLLCWEYPLNTAMRYFVPPLFSEVKAKLVSEIQVFIQTLRIGREEKDELLHYYDKVWTLVTSGEIKLELDLHFELGASKYVVDFKSGFSSNEKGNTNRLLLVASTYKILDEGHKCLIFVRAPEDQNNHYLQTLKNSGIWEVNCGADTYDRIKEFTGFDLRDWLHENVTWSDDFHPNSYEHFKQNELLQYLQW